MNTIKHGVIFEAGSFVAAYLDNDEGDVTLGQAIADLSALKLAHDTMTYERDAQAREAKMYATNADHWCRERAKMQAERDALLAALRSAAITMDNEAGILTDHDPANGDYNAEASAEHLASAAMSVRAAIAKAGIAL